jgi:L-ribulokinase
MAKYAIGLDFGSLSVRALMIDIVSGAEVAQSVFEYPHRIMDHHLPSGERLPGTFALQDPQDYLEGMMDTIQNVVRISGAMPEEVVGIGVDATGTTIMPVTADKKPLCATARFAGEPQAYLKMWKHHGGEAQAERINQIAEDRCEKWLSLYGGKVSSEWVFPKILETLELAPAVYDAADYFIDAVDWIVWQLTDQLVRSGCVMGYKAFYRADSGYPDRDFFAAVNPRLVDVATDKLAGEIKPVGSRAGVLSERMAAILGLAMGTPVGTGILDAHASVAGSGVTRAGEMMIVMGTSSCHMLLSDTEKGMPGVAGVVKDGIMPGTYGLEAGQSCVGNGFAWFVEHCVPESYEQEARDRGLNIHQLLTDKLKDYRAGQSGLLCLDWFNGVRSPLADFDLNGMMLGLNLQTKPEEMYLSIIEATAFGTRLIIEQFENAGMPIESVVLSGGIPMKNPMIVQVYADIIKRPIRISGTTQACATGAAILDIAAAGEKATGYADMQAAARAIGKIRPEVYTPNPDNTAVYDGLYADYKILCDYFGRGANDVMKRLNKVRLERAH